MPCSKLCGASGLPALHTGEHERLFRVRHWSVSCKVTESNASSSAIAWGGSLYFLCWGALSIPAILMFFYRPHLCDTILTATKPAFTLGLWGKLYSISIYHGFLLPNSAFQGFVTAHLKAIKLVTFLPWIHWGEKLWIYRLQIVTYADTDGQVCSRQVPVWLAANQLLQVGVLDACIASSTALPPALFFQTCNMGPGSCDSKWCQSS